MPFERALFLEDFSFDRVGGLAEAPPEIRDGDEAARTRWLDSWETRYAEYRDLFTKYLDGHRDRVLVRELPPLTTVDNRGATPEPGDAKAFRNAHYEQVGQWIAEASTVMLAVMETADEKASAEANGGTARIVACRLEGRPHDEAGDDVARRSAVLRQERSPVLPPSGRHVWLIASEKPDRTGQWPPCDVLKPRTLPFPGDEPAEVSEANEKEPLRELAASLAVAERFKRVHRHLRWFAAIKQAEKQVPAMLWFAGTRRLVRAARIWRRDEQQGLPAFTSIARHGPIKAIKEVGSRLESQQLSKALSKQAFWTMAMLFLVSLTTFEVFAKFAPGITSILVGYVLCTALSGVVIAVARWRMWQALAEDSRSVIEMLRVQGAWWAAGLPDRVDREHLQGVAEDLGQIRDTGTTLLAWIWLRSPWPGDTPEAAYGATKHDWAFVRGTAAASRPSAHDGKEPSDWIGGQLHYFWHGIEERERAAHRAEAGSWFLFIAAWWLAALIAVWSSCPHIKHWFQEAADWTRAFACDLAFLPWLAAAALVLWARLRERSLARSLKRHPFWRGIDALIWPFPSAILIGFAAMAAGPTLAHHLPDLGEAKAPKYIALVGVALLIGATGAWRFLAEKFGYEAEALEFRDAWRRFWMAEQALARNVDAGGAPHDEVRAQTIVRELGRRALIENEAWLKSRRERPLTPLAG